MPLLGSRLLIVLSLLAPVTAAAHTVMTAPTPRSESDGLKSGPCGNVAPTGSPTVFAPGQTITVDFLETVDHPGWYRLAWSSSGDAEFEDKVLLDDIADEACASTPCSYSAEVTLPDEECEGCALQLIQYMTEGATPSLYYSCADIDLLTNVDAPDAGGSSGGADAGPDGEEPDTSAPVSGGCSSGGDSAGLAGLLLLLWLGKRERQKVRV